MNPAEQAGPVPTCGDLGLYTELIRMAHTLHLLRTMAGKDSAVAPGAVPLLAILDRSGAMRSRDLAAVTFLDPSTVSRQVDSLVRGGHIRRIVDPDDGRASLLELTEQGADLLAARRRSMSAIIDDMTEGWSQTELDHLVEMLTRFNDAAGVQLPVMRSHPSQTTLAVTPHPDAADTTIKERTA